LAQHDRVIGPLVGKCYRRKQQSLNLEHYLEVLERKPGALAGPTPPKQWREQGRWPAEYDRFWQGLRERQGKQAGTRQMIELLGLGKKHGYDRLQEAVKSALSTGCHPASPRRPNEAQPVN